ncbi:hypothetical protein BHE74_00010164 [Ensete ventricosum]|nr:hypothetical protein BHE74_00010164 [Ensete ventricosum]
MIGYPIGRSDSSKPTPDGQPRQHFGGSHVSPRDQVDSQSVIQGGGSGTTLPGPTPINVAWRAMPSPHATAVAHPPYISATSRGTTKVRLGVQTNSLLTGSSSLRRPKEQADRALRREPPRERQPTQEVSTPTDVGGLAHLDENRSSRHLSSTPEKLELGSGEKGPGSSLRSRDADRMDLDELHGKPKVSGGKAPSTRTVALAREVVTSPARETPKASSKRPIDASTEQVDDPARRLKKVKVLTRRHKSRHGERETRSHSKGKEPAAPSAELETLVEFDEGGASLVHHRSRSMKDLFKTKVHKDDAGYYTLHMSDLGHQDPDNKMKTMWRGLKNSTKIWNDSSATEKFERGLLHPQLARELYTLPSEVLLARATKEIVLMALFDRVCDAGRLITFMDYRISNLQQELDDLKSGGGPEAVAKAEERAFKLEQELGKTK